MVTPKEDHLMKVIVAIIQNADRNNLTEAFRKLKIAHTRLNTMGGFLSQGNTTFLIGAEDDAVDSILDVIKRHCHEREALHKPGAGALHPDAYVAPVHVQIGGATIFVMNAEQFRL